MTNETDKPFSAKALGVPDICEDCNGTGRISENGMYLNCEPCKGTGGVPPKAADKK
jgi:DnaJ-class molecular chaperone